MTKRSVRPPAALSPRPSPPRPARKAAADSAAPGRGRTPSTAPGSAAPVVLLLDARRITFDYLSIVPEVPGLLAVASYLATQGYDARVHHGEPGAIRRLVAETLAAEPVLAVGFYCDFENQTEVAALSRHVWQTHGVPVILGGPQVVGFDQHDLREAACLAAVPGEGEEVLTALLEALRKKAGRDRSKTGSASRAPRPLPHDDWRNLPGLMYLDEEGLLVRTPAAPPLADLDALPFPDFSLWKTRPKRMNMRYVLSGRGCPFRCAFCYEGSNSRKLRLRSVPNVLREVGAILADNPEVNYITFIDDTFTIAAPRVRAFCRGLAELREKRSFGWYAEGHVRLLARQPQLLKTMAAAGLKRLQIGIESGVQKVLDAYGKTITPDEIERVVRLGAQAGIDQIVGFFLFGGPFDSPEVQEANKAFATRLIEAAPGVISLGPSAIMLYPDTALTRCPSQFGLRVREHGGITTFADYPVTETEALTREDIARNQQDFVRHVIHTMKRVFRAGRIPHETILQCYRNRQDLQLNSVWEVAVYREERFLEGYYAMLARGAVSRSCDVPPAEIDGWRPQRVFEMWHDLDFSEGFARLGDFVLSPLEFELIRHATGKQTLAEMLAGVHRLFADRYRTRSAFDREARKVLRALEGRHLLAYAPL
jgi:anaerobic magnesium-protoporphyrin IX monomethyl ester cyclase